MKKLIVLIIILFVCETDISAQNKSQINNLSILAKTWGMLKYYHPEIASGKHNWDSILIAAVRRLDGVKGEAQLSIEIDRMLTIAGEDTAAIYLYPHTDLMRARNFDLSWIEHSRQLLSSQKIALYNIAKRPFQGKNFYAEPNPENDGNVVTPNEKTYPDMLYPDKAYRLLGLFRFWNVINYFYPYKYKVGRPWGDVLTELIPAMVDAKNVTSYHKAISRMSASINDSHGGLWPQVKNSLYGKYSPSFNFRLIGGKAVVTLLPDSVAMGNPELKVGSVIETIGGITLKQRIKESWDYVAASNEGGKLKAMHDFILNGQQKSITVTGRNPDGKKFNTTIALDERNFLKEYLEFFEMTSPITSKMLKDNIGYVFFSNINAKNLDSVMVPMMKTKAIIFDMRNYPRNGSGTYHIPRYLLSKAVIYGRNTSPDFSLPGMMKYEVSNIGTSVETVGRDNQNPYTGLVVLLVDERTQSAAEWACMTLMTYKNLVVIGSQTAGADGNVTRTVLPGGYKINFSGLGMYFPDGSETQRVGIPINITVNYSIKDLANKQDPIMAKALKYIAQKTGVRP